MRKKFPLAGDFKRFNRIRLTARFNFLSAAQRARDTVDEPFTPAQEPQAQLVSWNLVSLLRLPSPSEPSQWRRLCHRRWRTRAVQLNHASYDRPSGLPWIPQAGCQFIYQSIVAIGGLQQHSAAVGTILLLIKLGNDRLAKNSREQQTLCRAMLAQVKASDWSQNRVDNGFVP